jgi:hypothetical protein
MTPRAPPSGAGASGAARPRTSGGVAARAAGSPRFEVPRGELGTCLGLSEPGEYHRMARRVNDGIYVKKLRPNTAAGPLKVDYDYMGRNPAAVPHTTQEGTVVYGSMPVGAKDTKSYRAMSERVQDGLYVKIFGYRPARPHFSSRARAVPATRGHASNKGREVVRPDVWQLWRRRTG